VSQNVRKAGYYIFVLLLSEYHSFKELVTLCSSMDYNLLLGNPLTSYFVTHGSPVHADF